MNISMLELRYDLHIHSCLSPCGDYSMTPANIVGMAKVKGLDVIALTDHNSCGNCGATMKYGEYYQVMVIPGMELTTYEEVHVICLFASCQMAIGFEQVVNNRMEKVKNREELFGEQLIYNENDQIVGNVEHLLICRTNITFDETYDLVKKYGGAAIPAHIDKKSNSAIANLGWIGTDRGYSCVEISNLDKWNEWKENYPFLNHCKVICNSDAHFLYDIHEPEYSMLVEQRKVESVLEYLRSSC